MSLSNSSSTQNVVPVAGTPGGGAPSTPLGGGPAPSPLLAVYDSRQQNLSAASTVCRYTRDQFRSEATRLKKTWRLDRRCNRCGHLIRSHDEGAVEVGGDGQDDVGGDNDVIVQGELNVSNVDVVAHRKAVINVELTRSQVEQALVELRDRVVLDEPDSFFPSKVVFDLFETVMLSEGIRHYKSDLNGNVAPSTKTNPTSSSSANTFKCKLSTSASLTATEQCNQFRKFTSEMQRHLRRCPEVGCSIDVLSVEPQLVMKYMYNARIRGVDSLQSIFTKYCQSALFVYDELMGAIDGNEAKSESVASAIEESMKAEQRRQPHKFISGNPYHLFKVLAEKFDHSQTASAMVATFQKLLSFRWNSSDSLASNLLRWGGLLERANTLSRDEQVVAGERMSTGMQAALLVHVLPAEQRSRLDQLFISSKHLTRQGVIDALNNFEKNTTLLQSTSTSGDRHHKRNRRERERSEVAAASYYDNDGDEDHGGDVSAFGEDNGNDDGSGGEPSQRGGKVGRGGFGTQRGGRGGWRGGGRGRGGFRGGQRGGYRGGFRGAGTRNYAPRDDSQQQALAPNQANQANQSNQVGQASQAKGNAQVVMSFVGMMDENEDIGSDNTHLGLVGSSGEQQVQHIVVPPTKRKRLILGPCDVIFDTACEMHVVGENSPLLCTDTVRKLEQHRSIRGVGGPSGYTKKASMRLSKAFLLNDAAVVKDGFNLLSAGRCIDAGFQITMSKEMIVMTHPHPALCDQTIIFHRRGGTWVHTVDLEQQ